MKIDEVPYILELEKYEGSPRMVVNKASDSIGESTRGVFIDNSYLKEEGISVRDVLFRLAHVINEPVAYDATRMNCDCLSTFIATGQVQWVTKTCLCYGLTKAFPKFHVQVTKTRRGDITRESLLEIESRSGVKEEENQGNNCVAVLPDFRSTFVL